MSISIETLKGFLNEKQVKYLYDADKEVFVISFSPNVILVRLEEHGEFLQFRTLNLFQYKEGKHKSTILQMLAAINYQRKLVKFGYDSDDGEINCCIDIPIEDNLLTHTQFFRCMAALLEALNEARNRYNTILETGKDPGSERRPNIDQLIEEIMKDTPEEKKSSKMRSMKKAIDDDDDINDDDDETEDDANNDVNDDDSNDDEDDEYKK